MRQQVSDKLHLSVREMYERLLQVPILDSVGTVYFNMQDVKFAVKSKDIIGGVIQEWVENWLQKENILFSKPANSQEWPDIILGSGEDLEIKSFNYDASPAFDLGNFRAYVDSLIDFPNRLFDLHMVFGYSSDEQSGEISIKGIWLKNIWELSGPSGTNILELQVKKGVPYNLRPKKFYSNQVSTFQDHLQFITALSQAIDKFDIYNNKSGQDWLIELKKKLNNQ
jgi:NgoBV restriction endonuclease